MLIRIIMYLFFFCIYCISIISIYIVLNLYYTFIYLIMTAVISNNYYLIRLAISWSVIIFFTCFFFYSIFRRQSSYSCGALSMCVLICHVFLLYPTENFYILQISDKFFYLFKFVQIKNVLKLSLERQKNLRTF